MKKFFLKENGKLPSGAFFMSGTGSNVEKIMEAYSRSDNHTWCPKVIVTDRPKSSRASILAEKFGIPLVACPIASFYREHGLDKVTLATEKGREIRALWTADLIEKLKPFEPDFGILAGFVPLTNLAAVLPCLNVHPGDLTYLKDNKRYLVGLHTVPLELAILEGLQYLRASVILVQPYVSGSVEVDGGHIFGISAPVPLDLQGHTLAELEQVYHARPSGKHVHGAYHDLLSELAARNQEKLKPAGDHVIYPQVIEDFVCGKFAEDENGGLLYRIDHEYLPVQTVEYHVSGTPTPIYR